MQRSSLLGNVALNVRVRTDHLMDMQGRLLSFDDVANTAEHRSVADVPYLRPRAFMRFMSHVCSPTKVCRLRFGRRASSSSSVGIAAWPSGGRGPAYTAVDAMPCRLGLQM
jgi:hypothetical protein